MTASTTDSWFLHKLGDTGRVGVVELLPGESPRRHTHEDHVRVLAEAGELPPVIVHRTTMRVVDGLHRLRAARLRSAAEIDVRWYDGPVRDAFPIAVQANLLTGLPLSADERHAATERIVRTHAMWSDRMIATIVGFAPGTVRAIRQRAGGTSSARIGRDGRVRPVSSAQGRRQAATMLTERPELTLRAIADATGLAASTVLDVRNRLRAGEDIVPRTQRRGEPRPTEEPVVDTLTPEERTAAISRLRADPSLRFTDAGRRLLVLLATSPERDLAGRLPAHCRSIVLAIAKQNAGAWSALVRDLQRLTTRLGQGRP
jgi:ParB-like nuclease family protein